MSEDTLFFDLYEITERIVEGIEASYPIFSKEKYSYRESLVDAFIEIMEYVTGEKDFLDHEIVERFVNKKWKTLGSKVPKVFEEFLYNGKLFSRYIRDTVFDKPLIEINDDDRMVIRFAKRLDEFLETEEYVVYKDRRWRLHGNPKEAVEKKFRFGKFPRRIG